MWTSPFPPQAPDPLQASVLICKHYFCESCVLVSTFIRRREMKSKGNLEKQWREKHSSNNICTIWRQMLRLWKVSNKNKKASTKGALSVKYSLVFPTPPVLNIRYVSAQPRYVTGMFPPPLCDATAIRMVGCRHGNIVMLPFVRRIKWPVARSNWAAGGTGRGQVWAGARRRQGPAVSPAITLSSPGLSDEPAGGQGGQKWILAASNMGVSAL